MVLEAFEAKAYYTTLAPSASLRLLLQNKKIYIYKADFCHKNKNDIQIYV